MTTTCIPICSVYRPSLNTVYQPRTLPMTYKSLHLILTDLKLYYTASNKLATTSGDSLSQSLAPQQRTTSSGTSSTPNSPWLRPHLASPPSRRFATPLQRAGSATILPSLRRSSARTNLTAPLPHSVTLPHQDPASDQPTKPKTSDNKKLTHDVLATTRSNSKRPPAPGPRPSLITSRRYFTRPTSPGRH
jgi:hypothetical protein